MLDSLKMFFSDVWRLLAFVAGGELVIFQEELEEEDCKESTMPKSTAPISPKGWFHFRG